MTCRITTASALALILSVLSACSSDSKGGGNPLGPETPDPPARSVTVEVLKLLLHDPYSVEGLSHMLLDQVEAEGMRQQAKLLAADLDVEELVAFADHLAGLQQLNIAYLSDSGFDFHDLPIINALQLYVKESEVVLEEDGYLIPGFKRLNN